MSEVAERRRLAPVLLVLLGLLVVAVPFGVAWWSRQSSATFADSELIGVNRLGAATLDLEVGNLDVDLEATNLAPGDEVTGTLELVNAGDLPLRYALTASSSGGLLADWLRWDVWAGTCAASPGASGLVAEGLQIGVSRRAVVGDVATGAQPGDRTLAVGASETLCLQATLPIAAPNEVQGAITTIDLAVVAEHDLGAQP